MRSLPSNRVAGMLIALGPLGFMFALVMGHDGHLARVPLLVGGVGGLLGLAFKVGYRRTKEEAL